MHASQRPAKGQQRRLHHYASNADADALFNLLTGPELLDRVEALLPEHRERLFPPTETLSLFLAQALSADGSCRQVVNDALVKRVIGGTEARQYGHRWLLSGTGTSAAEDDFDARARDGRDRGTRGSCWVALAGSSGAFGRRGHGQLGGHARESSRLSAAERSEGGAGVSDLPCSGAAVSGQRGAD